MNNSQRYFCEQTQKCLHQISTTGTLGTLATPHP